MLATGDDEVGAVLGEMIIAVVNSGYSGYSGYGGYSGYRGYSSAVLKSLRTVVR